jgi:hypothetical protein
MRIFMKLVTAGCLLLPNIVLAKGDGVGFTMEGTVANISISGERIHFTFTGTFYITQFHRQQKSVVEIDCKHGVSATVSQGDPFFAMSTDGRAGAIRPAGELLKILRAAVEHKRSVKFELYDVGLTVGEGKDFGHFTLTDARVVRASDADLR